MIETRSTMFLPREYGAFLLGGDDDSRFNIYLSRVQEGYVV